MLHTGARPCPPTPFVHTQSVWPLLQLPPGFAANLAALTVLATRGCTVYSDELNHASIIDGTRLAGRAGATTRVYRHCDYDHLEALLRSPPPTEQRRLIVTDSLFSMDGDVADLKRLAALRQAYGALLLVDEAHATLVLGKTGGGAVQAAGVEREVGKWWLVIC